VSPASERFTRRVFLAAGTAFLTGIAGCGTGSSESTPTDPGGSQSPSGGAVGAPRDVLNDSGTDGSGTGLTETDADADADAGSDGESDSDTATATAATMDGGTTTPGLDLREANVTAVEFEGGDGSYDFDVTLYHDDDGEDGYADWWQVESLGGEQLGRRTLLHAHSTAPFTRSETIDVPSGTTCVVVRGHDQTHEYGGQAMLVNLDTGATRAVEQGPDPATFDASDCPS